MGIEQAPTKIGRESAKGLRRSAAVEEKKPKRTQARTLQKAQTVSKSARKALMAKVRAKSRRAELLI